MVQKITQPITPLENTGKINEIIDNLDTKLNKQAISNCITEIPQDIKLELNNGTLTLKAGSKVYVPNGAGKFDVVTISSDKTITTNSGGVVFINSANQAPNVFSYNLLFSGNTTPTGFSGNGVWYNTTNNVIKNSVNAGSSWANVWSFPIAIVSASNGTITSIDQVFNGFGYIGSTVFALPGVKGLIPNGRNADGTLKNIEFVNPAVRTYDLASSGTYNFKLALAMTGIGAYFYAYDPVKNAIYRTDTGAYYNADRFIAGDVSISNGKITSFQPKTAFHAVDYNDLENLDDKVEKLNNENVKLTGTQTIAGGKSFTTTNGLKAVTSGSNNLIIKDTSLDGAASSRTTTSVSSFSIYDKNDKIVGMYSAVFNANGTNQSRIQIRNYASGSQVIGELIISVDENGTVSTSAPTPASAIDNSTQIATTAWCTNASKNGNLFGAPNYAGVITAANEYVAPSNGYYSFCVGNGNVNNSFYYIYVNSALVGACNGYGTTGGHMVALKKGDRVSIRRNDETTLVTVNWALFFPCL